MVKPGGVLPYVRPRACARQHMFHHFGTCAGTEMSALSGDSPVKNWTGAGVVDFPSERAHKISDQAVVSGEGYKSYGCWGCPVRCGGKVVQTTGKFPLKLNEGVGHKPEYETLCMFGTNLLNDDLASINRINEICNNLGLDTISVGATIGYVIECYENGLLTKEDTDGLDYADDLGQCRGDRGHDREDRQTRGFR